MRRRRCRPPCVPGLSRPAPRARSAVLPRTHRLMLEHAEELAQLIVAENGKALPDARAEVAYAASSSAGTPKRVSAPPATTARRRPAAPAPSSPSTRSGWRRW
ncbi:aldehyde dehydrogenase family protein [Streptomyces sp. NPDC059455]|uniref:aldehyde dehydrogenase family protein n=1 Tax=Streptomyces sp. NPDC059455 TaxID=3346837 RepID=UPI00367B3CD1